MGVCASSQTSTTSSGRGGGDTRNNTWQSTIKVISMDGRLQELKKPIKAGQLLSENPKCFLCSLETMEIDSLVPQIPQNEDLRLGHIYFPIALSRSHVPLSLPDLCVFAIKASHALKGKLNLLGEISSVKARQKQQSVRLLRTCPQFQRDHPIMPEPEHHLDDKIKGFETSMIKRQVRKVGTTVLSYKNYNVHGA